MSRTISIKTLEEKLFIFNYLKHGSYPENATKEMKRTIRKKCESLILINDYICYKKVNGKILRVVLEFEEEVNKMILDSEHSDSHIGITKMIDIVNRKYYGMKSSWVIDFVKSCNNCRNFVALQTLNKANIIDIVQKHDRYVVDCVDLRRYSGVNDGYGWILNVIDS